MENKIIHGDAIDEVKKLEDNSIDLIVIDPPYGINFKRSYKKGNQGDEKIIGDNGFDVLIFIDDLLEELKRVLKDGGAIYCFTRFDVYPYLFLKFNKYFNVKNQLVWHKGLETTGMGDRQGDYAHNYESILFAVKGRHILRKKICGSVWSFKLSKNKYHFTEKPLDVIKEIIEFSSDEGAIILDCFLGSGTTLVACEKTNRRGIGIEINKEYCEIARKRLNEPTPNKE